MKQSDIDKSIQLMKECIKKHEEIENKRVANLIHCASLLPEPDRYDEDCISIASLVKKAKKRSG